MSSRRWRSSTHRTRAGPPRGPASGRSPPTPDLFWSLSFALSAAAWTRAGGFHQWHATETAPRRHLDDIVRNGALFASRWGHWPMGGWLAAFERDGLVRRTRGGGWERTRPAPAERTG